MRIILVRHCQTEWNALGKLQGQSNNPLNEDGKRLAKKLAKALEKIRIDKIYSSDLKRCLETAREIAKKHNAEIGIKPEIREIDLGEMEGVRKEEVKKLNPGWYERRKEDKYNIPFPDGESYADVEKRITPFLEEVLKAEGDSTILIVAHEGTNRVIIGKLLGMENREIPKISSPIGCIYFIDLINKEIEYEIDGVRKEGILKRE